MALTCQLFWPAFSMMACRMAYPNTVRHTGQDTSIRGENKIQGTAYLGPTGNRYHTWKSEMGLELYHFMYRTIMHNKLLTVQTTSTFLIYKSMWWTVLLKMYNLFLLGHFKCVFSKVYWLLQCMRKCAPCVKVIGKGGQQLSCRRPEFVSHYRSANMFSVFPQLNHTIVAMCRYCRQMLALNVVWNFTSIWHWGSVRLYI